MPDWRPLSGCVCVWHIRRFGFRSPDFPACREFAANFRRRIAAGHRNKRVATSVGGTFTGKGAGLIIIDDPMTADDAFSETRRDDVYGWLTSTVISRFNDPKTGALIVVAQRRHVDDRSGRMIAAGGWEVLELPAIATPPAKVQIGQSAFKSVLCGAVLDREAAGTLSLDDLVEVRAEDIVDTRQ